MHVGELLFEFGDSFLGEVAWNEEVSISDKEVREGLLDEALNGLLEGLVDFAEVSSDLEHLGVQLLESAFVGSSFAHFRLIFEKILFKLETQ